MNSPEHNWHSLEHFVRVNYLTAKFLAAFGKCSQTEKYAKELKNNKIGELGVSIG